MQVKLLYDPDTTIKNKLNINLKTDLNILGCF